jgi:phosphatidylserine/phosphatidylglycerophosphate/cardiolipin synthase-like enzyme
MVKADALPTPPQQKLAHQLAAAWESVGSVDGLGLATALRAAQAAAARERLAETIELVWTGPKSAQVPVAMNAEALNEVVDAAQSELLVVSYATYQMPKLVERLSSAFERGVSVDLVLEFHGARADEPQTWDPVKGLGGELPDGVRVYEWPVELRQTTDWGKVGYLHVKCAVADGRHALVSSANLTVYAMEMNMELGVVVRGGEVPGRIARHFAALIDEGILKRVQV